MAVFLYREDECDAERDPCHGISRKPPDDLPHLWLRQIRTLYSGFEDVEQKHRIRYTPIAPLTGFLPGHLAAGFSGRPDVIIAGILLGSSVFVYLMVRLLSSIVQKGD